MTRTKDSLGFPPKPGRDFHLRTPQLRLGLRAKPNAMRDP